MESSKDSRPIPSDTSKAVKKYEDNTRQDFIQNILIENLEESNASTSLRKKPQGGGSTEKTDDGRRNKYEIKHGYTNVHILKDALVSSKIRQVNQRTNTWRTQVHFTISGLPELDKLVESKEEG